MKCIICNEHDVEKAYTPIQSKIDLVIYLCKTCGHVFGDYDETKFELTNQNRTNDKLSHLSCEADYSEVRVGKQQMSEYFFNAYSQLPEKRNINTVLDFKSARGDFALKILERFGLSSVDCIEEDEYMTKSYKSNDKVNISHNKYYDSFVGKTYDLVYSCHSLEHYRDPRKVITYINKTTNENGLFYIDVPNIKIITNNLNIDDFFYDKHLHYFTCELLINLIEQCGFKLLINNTTQNNIGLLFEKASKKTMPMVNSYEENKKVIENYKQNISNNREKIKKNIKLINNLFNETKSNVILGCGRGLDTMIKYGELDISKFKYFVDDFLIKATNTVYGRDLTTLDSIEHIDGILVLVKNISNELSRKIQNIDLKISYNEILK